MNLCRFALNESPTIVRSGVYHDGRLYETDGDKAIGIHDPGKFTFLCPVGNMPSLRLFDFDGGNLTYRYANPTGALGPHSELEVLASPGDSRLVLRVLAVLKDGGTYIDAAEAGQSLLAFTLMAQFVSQEPIGPKGWDSPMVVGPFLMTPDTFLGESAQPQTPSEWAFKLTVNGETALETKVMAVPFESMIEMASKNYAIQPGDCIASPPLPLDGLPLLRPTDVVLAQLGEHGILRFLIA